MFGNTRKFAMQHAKNASIAMALGVSALISAAPALADSGSAQKVERTTGKPARLEGASIMVTSIVEKIDYKARKLTLKNAQGEELTVDVGPEIQRLDEVKKGDTLEIEYLESIAVSVHAPTDKVDATEGASSVLVRNPTASPSGKLVETEQTTATVASVDAAKRVVELVRDDGSHAHVAVAPEVRLDEVRKGDLVVVRKTRALALKIRKPEAK
jgi:hypothetical protein